MKIECDTNLLANKAGSSFLIFWNKLNFTNVRKDEVDIPDNIMYDLRSFHIGHDQSNFTTKLIQLILKADKDNFYKLSEVYPNECYVVWCYQNISGFVEKYLK